MLNKTPPKYLFRLTVVKGFKVIHQAQDVLVSLRDLAHNVDFIPDHVFTSFHELLVDNLDSIKLVGFNLVQKTANECLLWRACSLCNLHAWPLRISATIKFQRIQGQTVDEYVGK